MLCLPTGKNKIRGGCTEARSVQKTMVIGDGDGDGNCQLGGGEVRNWNRGGEADKGGGDGEG